MATNYPASLDNGTSIPNPTGVNTQNSPDHASLHSNTGDGLKAVEAKLGIGATTPTSNTLLFGTGTGTSAWGTITSAQLLAALSDETGTGKVVFGTSPTLITPAIDTVNESTPGNGTTIGGVNIKSGALATSNSVVTANVTDNAITFAKVANGFPVQIVATNFSAVATGTTLIPYDDTIPQITEGTEFMTQAITPKSATNNLVITVISSISTSAVGNCATALFQDANVNALAVGDIYLDTTTLIKPTAVTHTMVAGTSSSTTFRVRIGNNNASTITFNGESGARKYGATTKSSITITEYKA